MSKTALILIGGGDHCRSCIDVIESNGSFEIAGILDVPSKVGAKVSGYTIIDSDEHIERYAQEGYSFLVSFGMIRVDGRRKKVFERIKAAGGKLPLIVSGTAYVSRTAEVMEGTIVMHRCVVNANASVGVNCILNTACIIEHDARIGDHCHISVNAVVNGTANIGEEVFLGSGAIVSHLVSVAPGTVVGAGTTVYRSINEPGTYTGSPTRKIR
jgi:sugar O-acyltransferase (sialic acid O-acetyltransferase NeuD family)